MKKIFRFISLVIKSNRYKIVLISSLSILSYICYLNIDEIYSVKPITSFQNNGKFAYVYQSENSYSVKEFKTPQKLVNDQLVYTDLSTLPTIGITISLFCLAIILIVGIIAPDNDVNWNFYDCWVSAVFKEIKCEEEDGFYYYSYKNRLLQKTDHPDGYTIKRKLETLLEVGENMFPKFEGTTKTRRDKRISEIIN